VDDRSRLVVVQIMKNELDDNLCPNCVHPKNKHAFDIVVTDRKNPCELSCMICFDMVTKRSKPEATT